MNIELMKANNQQRFGMVIDLNRCVGCQTCTAACKHANDTTPDVQWRRVLDLEFGSFPDVQRLFMVTGCQHCADPPCVPVCPTGATFAREDGLVVMQYDDCIGCGYCAVSCPYQARTIAHEKHGYFDQTTRQEESVAHPERYGVAQKCTFCIERIDEAAQTGATPGIDLDVTPACASACIAQAIHFGDFNDTESNVSTLLAENHITDMHPGLNTQPQIRYLLNTPAVDPRETIEEPAQGPLQTFWDLRAACNFIFGGLSSGMMLSAFGMWMFSQLSSAELVKVYAIGCLLMLVGLGAVFLEISHKLRSMLVLTRVRSSWMSREAWFALAIILFTGLDLGFTSTVLHVLVAICAAGFLYSQARILHAGKGIPAWRVPEMPALVVCSGMLEGLGALALLIGSGAVSAIALSVPGTLAVIFGCISAILWHTYCARSAADYDLEKAEPTENLFSAATRSALADTRLRVHWVGHALPLLATAVGLVAFGVPGWLLIVAGAGAILGGMLWKATVITRAAHHQGLTLPRIPGRGSGTRAAPRRPGFSRT